MLGWFLFRLKIFFYKKCYFLKLFIYIGFLSTAIDWTRESRRWIGFMLARILLHHIMFLPFEEVVQTSVLSKRWKEARDAYRNFEFTDASHNVNRNKKKKDTLRSIWKKLCRSVLCRCIKKLTFRMELSN